jgi:hypothetical protein
MERTTTTRHPEDQKAAVNRFRQSKVCQLSLLCSAEATTRGQHPVLGDIPLCQRCADTLATTSFSGGYSV